MGQLFLVRHAQASFLEPDYDKLSALGENQARLLGKYLAVRRIVFEQACTGPRVRQKDTAKLVGEVYRNEGAPFPALRVLPEFDEYHGEAVLEKSLPELLETDPRIRDLHAAHYASGDAAGRHATFQKLFEAVISKWACGLICPQGVEPWSEFCSRVNSGSDVIFIRRRTRRTRRNIYFGRSDRSGYAACAPTLYGKHSASELDVAEILRGANSSIRTTVLHSALSMPMGISMIPRCSLTGREVLE